MMTTSVHKWVTMLNNRDYIRIESKALTYTGININLQYEVKTFYATCLDMNFENTFAVYMYSNNPAICRGNFALSVEFYRRINTRQ